VENSTSAKYFTTGEAPAAVSDSLSDKLEVRRLAAVMFADMVGYTALTQRDESLALSLLEKQNGIVLPLIRAFGGTPVKTIGDAHLAEFESTLAAIRCGVEIQRKLREYNTSSSPDQSLKLRIGIHVGDVVHKDNDVYGDAVNIAARLEPIADPGGVCISQQVYDQVQNKVEFRLERLPSQQLKNVNQRIDIYKVIDSALIQKSDLREEDLSKERVAILPLSNYSPSSQDEYLADGMTEELITAISGVVGLRVIARTSVMRFKNSTVDISEIGRTLRAGTILEGSFRKVGERIRVTVQLIDAKTEEHIWASNYDGNMQDIFSIQTDIANKVAQALKVKLLVPAQRQVNIEAYELYLKGRNYWNRRTADGVTQALKLFTAAVEKDPSFAKAHAGIADCYLIGRQHQLFQDVWETQASLAIQKALELDDSIAEAHASRGLLLTRSYRFVEAQEEFRKGLSLNQSYASAHHWYAICLAYMGHLDEAIAEATLAAQSDPLAAPSRDILGIMYVSAREFDKALEIFDDILKLDPDFHPALQFRSIVYLYKGMEGEAARDLQRSLANSSEFEKNSMLALQAAWFGHKEEAWKFFEQAAKIAPSQNSLVGFEVAFAAVNGDVEQFFKLCDKALAAKELTPGTIRYEPWLDKMRADPRYKDLMKRLPS